MDLLHHPDPRPTLIAPHPPQCRLKIRAPTPQPQLATPIPPLEVPTEEAPSQELLSPSWALILPRESKSPKGGNGRNKRPKRTELSTTTVPPRLVLRVQALLTHGQSLVNSIHPSPGMFGFRMPREYNHNHNRNGLAHPSTFQNVSDDRMQSGTTR